MHKIFLSFLFALSAFCVATVFAAETDNDAAGGNLRMSVTAILSDLPADVHSSEVPAILSFHYFFDRIAEFDEIDLKWDKSLKRQCCLRATRSDTAEQNGSKTSNNFPVATVTMFSSIIRI